MDGNPGFVAGNFPGSQASTLRAALNNVAQAYRAYKIVSAVHDSRGQLDSALAAQLSGSGIGGPQSQDPGSDTGALSPW